MSIKDVYKPISDTKILNTISAANKQEPDELFKKLLNREQSSEVVDVRLGGDVFRFRFRVLTYKEQEDCKTSARQRLITEKNLKPDDFRSDSGAVKELYSDAVATEILFRALCREKMIDMPDGSKKFAAVFIDLESMVSKLTADEILVLFETYTLVQEKHGPNDYALWVSNNFDPWIDAVAQGAEYFPLAQFPLPILVETLQALAKSFILHTRLTNSENSGESEAATLTTATSSSTEDVSSSFSELKPKQITKTEALKQVLQEKNDGKPLFSMQDAIDLAKNLNKKE
jgi:hypothetical protein